MPSRTHFSRKSRERWTFCRAAGSIETAACARATATICSMERELPSKTTFMRFLVGPGTTTRRPRAGCRWALVHCNARRYSSGGGRWRRCAVGAGRADACTAGSWRMTGIRAQATGSRPTRANQKRNARRQPRARAWGSAGQVPPRTAGRRYLRNRRTRPARRARRSCYDARSPIPPTFSLTSSAAGRIREVVASCKPIIRKAETERSHA